MTLLTPQGATGGCIGATAEGAKGDDRQDRNRDKKEALSKVVIRRLPPTLTKEQLQEHLQPMPEHDYFEFFSNDTSLYPHMYARAYINFKNQEDILLFRDRFDGYVFLDNKGEYTIQESLPWLCLRECVQPLVMHACNQSASGRGRRMTSSLRPV